MDTRPLAATTPSPHGRRKRRLLPIVDARFQWKYAGMMTLLGAGTAAVMGTLLYRAQRDTSRLLELAADRNLQEQVLQADQRLAAYLALLVVVLAGMLAVWGLIVTHRISGPVYLAARYLHVLADGTYPDMRQLRKHDELQHFFAALTAAVGALRARDAARMRDVEAALLQVQRAAGSSDVAELREALKGAAGALETLREGLARGVGAGEGVAVDHHAELRRRSI